MTCLSIYLTDISLPAGAQRGRVNVDLVTLKDFESKEEKAYRYVLTPKRLVAAVDVKGTCIY